MIKFVATKHQWPAVTYTQPEDKDNTFYIWEGHAKIGTQAWVNFCKHNQVAFWKDVPEALKKYHGSLNDEETIVFADKNAKLFFLLKYS